MTEPTKEPKIPMAKQLVDIAKANYTVGRDAAGGVFIIPNTGPNVAMFERAAKDDLGYSLFDKEEKVAGRTPKDDAWGVIKSLARRLPKEKLSLRVGTHDGAIVLDVGDEAGAAILVSAEGWEKVPRSPITFSRTNVTLPLVTPKAGGDIMRIFDIVNVAPHHRRMFLAWLVAALIEEIPHPIMTLRGEQGSAKTTTAKAIKRLIVPSAVDSGKPPKDEDRWDSQVSAHWAVSIDNVS